MKTVLHLQKTYGFVPEKPEKSTRNAPSGEPLEGPSPGDGGTSRFCLVPRNRRFVTTHDFEDQAKNHCAATSLVNLLLLAHITELFPPIGSDMPEKERYAGLFARVHRSLPNGPVFAMTRRSNAFFAQNGVPMQAEKLFGPGPVPLSEKQRLIYESLHAGRPCALLLIAGPFLWHWVVALGCDGDSLLIEDNWHHRGLQRYTPDEGSLLLCAVSYHGVLPERK